MKQRFPKWDNLKCLLIVLVVVGHFIETFIDNSWMFKRMWFMIYMVHMPLFVFVSGLFAKNAVANVEKLKRNIAFYIKSYLVYKILLTFIKLVFAGETKFSLLNESSIPWYMLAMAIFLGITYLTRNVKPSYMIVMSIILACVIGYDTSLRDFLTLTRVINFYPFFLIGYYAKPDMKIFESSKLKKIFSVVVLTGFVTISWIFISKLYKLRPMLTGRNPYKSFCNIENGIIYRLAYYMCALILALAIIYIIPNKICSFTFIGKKTLPIYVWHGVMLNALRGLNWEEHLINNCSGMLWKGIVLATSIVVMCICCLPILSEVFDMLINNQHNTLDIKQFNVEDYIDDTNVETKDEKKKQLADIKG